MSCFTEGKGNLKFNFYQNAAIILNTLSEVESQIISEIPVSTFIFLLWQ